MALKLPAEPIDEWTIQMSRDSFSSQIIVKLKQ